MSTIEAITSKAARLPKELQKEVADFTDYLLQKFEKRSREDREWISASMTNAVRGFEDDPVTYSSRDVQ